MKKYPYLLLIALLVIAGSAIAITTFHKSPEPCPSGCNIIVIAVDTLSAKHTKIDGYDRDTMPRTEAFFADDFIFEEAYSVSPWTLPSFSSIYFSDLPNQISFRDLDERDNLFTELRKDSITIRSVLHPKPIFITDAIYKPLREEERSYSAEIFSVGMEKLQELQSSGNPFLLWLHTFEAHDPFSPKEPYDTYFEALDGYENITMNDLLSANEQHETNVERDTAYALRYDQGIASLDDRLGAFLETLPQEILDTTVIIVTSDHGEAFGEHGKVWHANSLYNEELHVPLFIRVPGISGRKISEPVSLLDLAPTILSFTKTPEPEYFKGESLAPLLLKGTHTHRPLMFVHGMPYFMQKENLKAGIVPPTTLAKTGAEGSTRPIIEMSTFGVQYGSIKSIWHIVGSDEMAQVQVFDLSSDPGEQTPLDMPLEKMPSEIVSTFASIFWRMTSGGNN